MADYLSADPVYLCGLGLKEINLPLIVFQNLNLFPCRRMMGIVLQRFRSSRTIFGWRNDRFQHHSRRSDLCMLFACDR
jgi:hypothetical protein